MKPSKKSVAAAAVAGALVAGGAAGAVLFGPNLAGAQTSTTTPGAGGTGAQNGSFRSNEDPAHEANETPEQEAAENNGTAFRGGHGGHGSNEDAAHEANETPEQEAAEDAARANGAPGQRPGAGNGTGAGTQPSSTRGAARVVHL